MTMMMMMMMMMRPLHTSRLPSSPYLPFCHNHSPPTSLLAPKPPFLILVPPPKQYPSLLNSYPNQKNRHRQQRPIITAPMASSTPSSTTGEAEAEAETKPFSVLFVCLGNICRSPAAEGVFTDLVKKKGLDFKFKIDSAGTINYHEIKMGPDFKFKIVSDELHFRYHEGNEADPRMRAAAKRRGIQITSMSRPIQPADFRDFDLILAMDKQNKDDILGALERWSFRETLPADTYKKVHLMCSYCKKHDETEVPDPYYGGPQGFEKVLDLLEDACESLLGSILAENNLILDS
ncbi:hypothetical protein TEA_000709 [Camellia sinensis var. sinensis]|uniref:Phosphotyrosine protein phosphatase I domain-containing protein n=1 Tax=Camellia sinensis var. sinensis TaxID=542762 RepID=A0A4S4DT72_CAMSN|nr:hypothetical protein TEA_000709 [Camellia sinensis var. sinensis]